jgi:hypothetical protein
MGKDDSETGPISKTVLDLNTILSNAELEAVSHFNQQPTYPICLIVGTPRSGTTLLLQWLAATNTFTYPSNLISRFFMAPYIGAKIQKMLTDPKTASKNEMIIPGQNEKDFFESDLGKTYGLFSPNEFKQFWERFFPFGDIQKLTQEKLQNVDMQILGSELAAFESVLKKPIVMKAMSLNWHIPFLARHIENVIFLYIKREPFYNAQSVLLQRRRLDNIKSNWYSYKPPEYKKLKNLNIYKQISSQIHFTNEAIENGLAKVSKSQKITIKYEDFCLDPINCWNRLNNRFNKLGFTLHTNYNGLDSFKDQNKIKVTKKETDRIAAAYYSLFGDDITPKQ